MSEFLRAEREEILTRVENSVRALSPAAAFDADSVLDAMPWVLDGVAELADPQAGGGGRVSPAAEADVRLQDRSEPPLDVTALVTAHALLREVMVGLATQRGRPPGTPLVRLLNQAVDRAVAVAVGAFAANQDRGWRALDRVLAAELPGGGGLDEQLRLLLHTFSVAVPAADSGAIFVREDGGAAAAPRLRLRAAFGAEEALVAEGPALAFGEGFAGGIAEKRAPALVRWAARDAQLGGELARRSGLRALYGVPLLESGEAIGVVHMGSLTAFDFSAQDRRILGALAARATAVICSDRLRAAAQRAGDARDEVMSALAHDLRSPLGVIQMQAALLEGRLPGAEDDPESKVGQRAQSILRSAERMRRLLVDLSDFASLGAGRLKLAPRALVVPDLVHELVAAVRPAAAELGVALDSELAPDLPELTGDRARLLQVLSHLVDNALEASPRGAAVTVRAARDGDAVRFSVEDCGPAIAPEQLSRLFDLPAPRGEKCGGRRCGALVLAISRGIVEMHGGRIWATSPGDGGGTTLSFTVPLAPPRDH